MEKAKTLKDLEVYKLSRELSRGGWKIVKDLSWHDQKIMGVQFIRATDSIGANIAEGYGRFHYLDRRKFSYQARGSLFEAASHWIELLVIKYQKAPTGNINRLPPCCSKR